MKRYLFLFLIPLFFENSFSAGDFTLAELQGFSQRPASYFSSGVSGMPVSTLESNYLNYLNTGWTRGYSQGLQQFVLITFNVSGFPRDNRGRAIIRDLSTLINGIRYVGQGPVPTGTQQVAPPSTPSDSSVFSGLDIHTLSDDTTSQFVSINNMSTFSMGAQSFIRKFTNKFIAVQWTPYGTPAGLNDNFLMEVVKTNGSICVDFQEIADNLVGMQLGSLLA